MVLGKRARARSENDNDLERTRHLGVRRDRRVEEGDALLVVLRAYKFTFDIAFIYSHISLFSTRKHNGSWTR